jgi:ABC-2 type transport system ATP-binding protein
VQLVEQDQFDAAKSLIAASLGPNAEPNVLGSETEGLVRFDSNLSDRELAGILANLLDKGVTVAQFREIPTDLEDAFLSVTSRGGDASAAEVPAGAASSREPT